MFLTQKNTHHGSNKAKVKSKKAKGSGVKAALLPFELLLLTYILLT